MRTLDSSEDADLELMFAEIRRYPLLTADEEKAIDSRKWAAVDTLSNIFAEIADLRAVAVHISPTEALLEIDGGSVLRVDPAGQSESRGAIWDVTDEALSPAAQVLLLDR